MARDRTQTGERKMSSASPILVRLLTIIKGSKKMRKNHQIPTIWSAKLSAEL